MQRMRRLMKGLIMAHYSVKNIDHEDWRKHPYMVIRDCRNEKAPNDGFWYYGSYDDVSIACNEANDIGNGVLVETSQVDEHNQVG